MTLLLALAVLPSFAVRPPYDLRLYLATAAHYASVNRPAALREIRQWSPSEIARATAALQRGEKRLRSAAKDPDDIDFHIVEAAVLLHAEAGLLFLQEQRLTSATLHLDAAVELLQWSRHAAADRRNWTTMRRHTFKDRPADPALELKESIEAWPDSQAARLGLAHALEKSSGPAASRELVGAMLDPSRRPDGPSDPWFLYPIGPPGLAPAAFKRVFDRTLGR